MKNILCVIESLNSGGGQKQLVELSKSLKEKGHNVSFLIFHPKYFFLEELNKVDIPVKIIQNKNFFYRFINARRFIRSGNFDAIISFLVISNLICEFASLPSKKWKLIVGERSADPKIGTSLKLRLFRFFHFLSDYIVANSQANIDLIKNINPLIKRNKFQVIYNTLDIDHWKPKTETSKKSKSYFTIVVAARHQYLKNFDGLIEAVNRLTEQDKTKLKIKWFGNYNTNPNDGSYEAGIQKIKKYQLEKNFELCPPSKNIKSEMEEADAVGLFSFYEGFPNAICEAMALGKPVIASNVSDLPFFLKNEPNLIVNPGNIEDLNKGLEYLIHLSSEDKVKIGQANRTMAAEKFNKEKIVGEYLNLLKG
ncbi:glycosyltransferase [Christiangramia sp. SM2212]|uniref:Glycosyltransferase n=1 Tax=Christiangramia sediminicola TaxID=3073267 RepID=A0ABU1EMP1_9FLAO|nr:glycosyltransferase [Christiangramia sp. SM2212]MDR5589337.1 glycosyltransferase [Christiangramia sp. SM2212]